MSNQRLRDAIIDAGLEVEQLADAVKVDVKTVERWLSGRTPYIRHRTRVATVLHVQAHDLWPHTDPVPEPPSPGQSQQTVVAYQTASDPAVPDWRTMITEAREQIELLDHSLVDIVSTPGIADLLAAKGAAGCKVRIMVAASEHGWVAEDDEDPEYDINAGNPAEVALNHARRHLAPLIGRPGVEIRQLWYGTADPILRFDDQLLYSPSLFGVPRTQAPTLHILRHAGGLFDRLTTNFEALWRQRATRVHPGWYAPDEDDYEEEDYDEHDDREQPPPTRREPYDQAGAPIDTVAESAGSAGDRAADQTGSLLAASDREQLTAALGSWGYDEHTIQETLQHAVFGAGLVGLQPDDPTVPPGVAILADEDRDPQLADLFQRRATLDDLTFLADWDASQRWIRVLTNPDTPEALVAYTTQITRPVPLIRTYLLLASKSAQLLSWLAQPGTNVWLIPQQAATEQANEGAGTEIYRRALPLGTVTETSPALEHALKHVGYSGTNPHRSGA